jgi:sporulation protein YlmC with PRC-barrel domain
MTSWHTGASAILASLLVAACAPGPARNMGTEDAAYTKAQPQPQVSLRDTTTPITYTQSVAFTPDMRPLNVQTGVWGTQPIAASTDLVLLREGELIGRRVTDRAGASVGTVEYLLVESPNPRALYAVVAPDRAVDSYVIVPLSATRLSAGGLQVDASATEISRVPRYTMAGLQQRHAVASLSPSGTVVARRVTVVQPPATVVPGATVVTPPVVAAPPVAYVAPPPAEQVYLTTQSDLVGRTVVDQTGQPVGTVDYVAVAPGTNVARYLVVGGGVFGTGNHVFVPVTQTQFAGGRVVTSVPTMTLMQAQRFPAPELQRLYVIN